MQLQDITLLSQKKMYGYTVIHPVALGFTLCMGILMLFLPRRYAIIPMLFAAIFITEMQRIVILSLDFNMMKILVLFGWARIILRREIRYLSLNQIDKTIIWLTISRIAIYTLQWRTSGAFINRLGGAFNVIGMYFLFRILIRDFDDISKIIISLSIITIPLAVSMLIERSTGRNAFAIFGGVPEFTFIRAGRLRCQGSFTHPILAGTFGATLLPLFVGLLFKSEKSRPVAIIGIIAAILITYMSASSGPVLSLLAGIMGLSLWPLRNNMRSIKIGLLFMLIGLQIYMKAPVWALIMRIGVVGGSTAYHRAFLIDQFVRRFKEWWLLGTKSTAHWGRELLDLTNYYVRTAVDGGLLTLILFIVVLVLCFRGIGKSRLKFNDKSIQFFLWSLGSALFAHVITFFGVSYFDQIIVSWYLLLSFISTASSLKESNEVANIKSNTTNQPVTAF